MSVDVRWRVVSVCSAVVMALCLVAYFIIMNESEADRGEAVKPHCWDYVSRTAAAELLGISESDILSERKGQIGESEKFNCSFSHLSDGSGTEGVEFSITSSPVKRWPYSSVFGITLYDTISPVGGGFNGWVSSDAAALRFPDRCQRDARIGNDPIVAWFSDSSSKRSIEDKGAIRAALFSFAGSVARKLGCSSKDFDLPERDVPQGRTLDGEEASRCGLSGFHYLRPGRTSIEVEAEEISDGDSVWTCVIYRAKRSDDGVPAHFVSLAYSQFPEMVREFKDTIDVDADRISGLGIPGNTRGDSSAKALLTCAGIETVLTVKRAQGSAAENTEPVERLVTSFAKSVSSKLSCDLE